MTQLSEEQAFKFFEQYGESAVFKKVEGSHHYHWYVKVNLVDEVKHSASLLFAIVTAADEHKILCREYGR
jgi:hypothetical protein